MHLFQLMQNSCVAVAGAVTVVALGQQPWAALWAGGSDPQILSPQDGSQVRCHREPVVSFKREPES